MDSKKELGMQVGDIVKSYDFPNRTDCYIIGTVTSVNELCDCVSFTAIKRVVEGVAKPINPACNNYNDVMFRGEGIFGTDYSKMVQIIG
jgi:hypothetical protein